MPASPVRVLHVEDDEAQRLFLAHHLSALKEYDFTVAAAESEQEAVESFQAQGAGLIVLDYHLSEGNGLSCLRRLRQLDPAVPIIAVSGVASPETAAELLRVGADDYISKADLDGPTLARSVRAVLSRADAWRARVPPGQAQQAAELGPLVRELCRDFADRAGPDLLRRLDELEAAARQAQLTAAQVRRLFEAAGAAPGAGESAARLARPLLLEMLLRLFGNPPGGARA